MPRSFLLRRSQDEGRANSKMQIDGRHSSLLLQTAAKLQRSPFEKDSKKKDNCFQLLTDQSALTNEPAFAVPSTYQSYIDGESFQRNNNLAAMKTEAGSFKHSKDQGGLDNVADCTLQLSQADEEAAKPSDGMGKTKGAVSGSKPIYRCEQCGKTFKTKYTLTIHLKMPNHTGARPFVCNICGKGFRLSSTLCRHKIIHTSDKPHKCHICQKAFNRSSTLKTHVRTHSEKKEFMCEVCGKGFHQKGNLRNHILIHTGEKPYRCRLCNKAFNKLSNLKFHLHIHTDNTPYRCRYCKTAFSRRCDLKQHIRTNHGQQMDAAEYFDDES